MTQGGLIVPAVAVTCAQGCESQGMAMEGEQSYEGIVVKKPAGKAAMAGEPAQESPVQAPTQKAGTWCEARNRGRKANRPRNLE